MRASNTSAENQTRSSFQNMTIGKRLSVIRAKFDNFIDNTPKPFLRVGFVLIPCLIYLARGWQYIAKPQLYAEDGTIWLSDAYNKGFRSLFTPYNGFAHTAERIWALLIVQLPLRFAPFLFDFSGFLIFALLCVYLFSNRLNILTNNYQKFFVGLSLGIIGNFSEFFFNFSNSIFLLGLIGLFIYLSKPSKNIAVRLVEKAVFVITCLTLPFAWFFLLIGLFDYFWKKEKKPFYLFASVTGSIVQLLAHHFSTYHRQSIQLSTLLTSRYTVIEFYNQIITPAFRFSRIDVSPSIPEIQFLLLLMFSALLLGLFAYIAVRYATANFRYVIFFLIVFTVSAFMGPLVGGNLSSANILKFMDTAQFGNRYFFYGILGMLLVVGLTSSLYIKRQALYWFLALFIGFGIFTSALYNSLEIHKGFTNYSPIYSKDIKTLSTDKSAEELTIPENPVGWYIVLYAK